MMRPGCCSAQRTSRQLTAPGEAFSSSLSANRRRRNSSVACAAAAASSNMTKKVKFAKYHGLGNDFILIDNRHEELPVITPEQAAKICDRNFGIGGDGVIFALPPQAPQANASATDAAKAGSPDYAMRIYNSDGSEPEMCGNGIRCLARFVADVDEKKSTSTSTSKPSSSNSTAAVATGAGIIRPEVLPDGMIRVDMGPPILTPAQIPSTLASTGKSPVFGAELDAVVGHEVASGGDKWLVTCVSMGNPHAIIFGKASGEAIPDVDLVDLPSAGAEMEKSPVFPAKTNVEFVQIHSHSHCKMRVWERGAGPTLACGTGACATVVAGVLEGKLERKCRVDLPGGPLFIEWVAEEGKEQGGVGGTVFMTGPAEWVFEGEVEVE